MEVFMKKSIGVLKRSKDLRSLWPNEAFDFTKWLAKPENLSLLSEEIGLDLEPVETESTVGGYRVDIFAKTTGFDDESDEKRVIIENQLEITNHDHLGKLITYAAGKNADVVVWIVKEAREEHRNAIKWLNDHLYNDKKQKDIAFFLVEIDSVQIGDSALAPEFKVVEKPNNWAKTMRNIGTMTKNNKTKLNFWEQFAEFYQRKMDGNNKLFLNEFSADSPSSRHYCDLRFGEQYHFYLFTNSKRKLCGISVYTLNKDVYHKFLKHKSQIQKILGQNLIWHEGKKSCTIRWEVPKLWSKNEDTWPEVFEWYVSAALKYKEVFLAYTNK